MSSREPGIDCAEGINTAAYVLGALEQPGGYREHLATCATCRAEVAELQRVVDALPATTATAAASAALRQRIMATVRAEAEVLKAAGPEADRPAKAVGAWLPRVRSLRTAGFALAAGVAVALAIALSVGSSSREHVFPGQLAASLPGAHASLREIGGRSELVVSGMPQPPPGKIYEVWLSRGAGSPEPTEALFSVTSRGRGSANVPVSQRGVKEIMVTSEPLGGSSHPTSPPLIRVSLRT